jgi:hypothetical protein
MHRAWSVGAGPITMLLIGSYFSPVTQGYYYTFQSLLTLQVLVELGFGVVIIQFASHEWARLRLSPDGRITGDAEALSRLASLARIALRWYMAGGAVLALGLMTAGYLFFSRSSNNDVSWVVPWLFLCGLTGMRMWLTPLWSLAEGCNQVSQVYGYRLVEAIVTSLFTWTAIMAGAALWVPVFASSAAFLLAVLFLSYRFRQFFVHILASQHRQQIGWRSEIWPMQWRIAVSWLSGYFVFALFVPVIFYYHGAVEAGRVGMTLSITGGLSMLASAWVAAKTPQFGLLIAEKNYARLDRLFRRVAIASTGAVGAGAVAAWLLVYILNSVGHPLASRLLPPAPLALFLTATVLMVSTFSQSSYLRAHKRDPLAIVTLILGLLTAATVWLLAKYSTTTAIAAGYAAISLITVITVSIVWVRCREAWHK